MTRSGTALALAALIALGLATLTRTPAQSPSPSASTAAFTDASLSQNPANPAGGDATTTPVMMGLGKDQAGAGAHPCAFTPIRGTRAIVTITGDLANTSSLLTGDLCSWPLEPAPRRRTVTPRLASGAIRSGTSTSSRTAATCRSR